MNNKKNISSIPPLIALKTLSNHTHYEKIEDLQISLDFCKRIEIRIDSHSIKTGITVAFFPNPVPARVVYKQKGAFLVFTYCPWVVK